MTGSGARIVSLAIDSAPGVAAKAWCDDKDMFVELTDGRLVRHALPDFVLAVPVGERGVCEVEEFGVSIWWPALDDGIGVNWLFGVSEEVIYDLAGFEKGPFPEDAA